MEKDEDGQRARPHAEGRNQFWCLGGGLSGNATQVAGDGGRGMAADGFTFPP